MTNVDFGSRELELNLRKGETFRATFIFTEEDASTPINLQGCAISIKFRRNIQDASEVITLTDGAGITLDADSGTFSIHISDEHSVSLDGSYVWDVRAEFSNGDVYFLTGGKLIIDTPVTR